jgi:hypothetical protein
MPGMRVTLDAAMRARDVSRPRPVPADAPGSQPKGGREVSPAGQGGSRVPASGPAKPARQPVPPAQEERPAGGAPAGKTAPQAKTAPEAEPGPQAKKKASHVGAAEQAPGAAPRETPGAAPQEPSGATPQEAQAPGPPRRRRRRRRRGR